MSLFKKIGFYRKIFINYITNKKNSRGDNIINEDNILRNGDTAQIVLEFKYNPQYLKPGTRFILAEGKCKIVGEVLSIWQNNFIFKL